MSRKTIDKKDITAEMLADLDGELSRFTVKLNERLNNMLPLSIFQEKHTSGHLWWKKTYYKYYRYLEGNILSVPKTDIEQWEKNR